MAKDLAGLPGAEGVAGVGLFFQQSSQQGIFIASVTPGCAGARTGCIKKGDLVVKVQLESVAGYSLTQLRQLVLGPPGLKGGMCLQVVTS